jgi:hypothetical protein
MITELKEVIIEEQTYSGSAFGVTEQGDGVFFNSRIVDAVGLKAGQTVQACLVPNFRTNGKAYLGERCVLR